MDLYTFAKNNKNVDILSRDGAVLYESQTSDGEVKCYIAVPFPNSLIDLSVVDVSLLWKFNLFLDALCWTDNYPVFVRINKSIWPCE